MLFQRDCSPDSLVSGFAERLWHTGLPRVSDAGQNRRRRHLRFGDDGSGAPVESEIGEVDLRQHQDQREQAKLETKQDPTPRLHQLHLYGRNLSHPASPVNKRKQAPCFLLMARKWDARSLRPVAVSSPEARLHWRLGLEQIECPRKRRTHASYFYGLDCHCRVFAG